MPYYSKEQYNLNLKGETFHEYVYRQAKPFIDQNALAATSLIELKKYLQERVKVVMDGYKACNKGRRTRRLCHNKTSKLYEAWSTPSRDKRIQRHIAATEAEIAKASLGVGWKSHFLSLDVFSFNKQVLTLYDISEIWRNKKYDSRPYVRPDRRWGLKKKWNNSKLSFKLL